MKGTAWFLRSCRPRRPGAAPHLYLRGRRGRAGRPAGQRRRGASLRGTTGEGDARTHHSLLRLDKRPAEAVHLAVETAGVAQVVAGAVPPPERRLDGAAVHALATLGHVLQQVCGEGVIKGRVRPRRPPSSLILPGRPPVPIVPVLATCCLLPCPRPSSWIFLPSSQARSQLVMSLPTR